MEQEFMYVGNRFVMREYTDNDVKIILQTRIIDRLVQLNDGRLFIVDNRYKIITPKDPRFPKVVDEVLTELVNQNLALKGMIARAVDNLVEKDTGESS